MRAWLQKKFGISDTPYVGQDVADRNSPRVVALSMVKNEQDIIESFILHNIKFVDVLIVVDNCSVDNTRDIIVKCARDDDRIVFADCTEFKYHQSEKMTQLLVHCQGAFFADFVVFLDADEFIGARDRDAFVKSLAAISPGGSGLMPWRTYVVTPSQERVAVDPPKTFTSRRKEERPQYYKAALRLDGRFPANLHVGQGSHEVLRGDAALEETELDVAIMHFPVRSASQLAAKAVVGWMANLLRDDFRPDQATQWGQAYQYVADHGVEAIEASLPERSMLYAQYPVAIDWAEDVVLDAYPFDYQRRYSAGTTSAVSVIARSWERSLRPPRPAVELVRPENVEGHGMTASSFDTAWHWDNLFFDVPPFKFIAEKYRPETVLDIGCGIGQYLALFKTFGTREILGIDGIDPRAVVGVLASEEYVQSDLTKTIDLARSFDLVVCTEVAEHLAMAHGESLLDAISKHATSRIIFSAAEPNQPGNGHINCQSLAYWLDLWRARGWAPNLMDSLAMRALATMSWFRRNLIVLQKSDSIEPCDATRKLLSIAAKPYAWYDQPPGIREMPFTEILDHPGRGYA